MMSEPLTGWRHVEISESRDTEDWIECMYQIADEHYPDADCIRVVLDNLSTHKPEAFYEFSRQMRLVSISIASSSTSHQFTAAG